MATQVETSALAAPHQPSSTAGARVQWIDATRGLAIILVVFGHAAGGLIDASAPGSLPALRYVFLAIYTFHMPIFFFLAGLFVEQRLERGIAPFFTRLLPTIVYPYFLWSILQYSLIFALGSLVNHPVENYWRTLVAIPWRPVSQFWFLHALFLIHCLGILAWRLGGVRAVLGAALLVKIVALCVPSTPALSLAAGNAPFYALGVLLGWQRVSALLTSATLEFRGLVTLCAVGALVLLSSQADAIQPYIAVEAASSAGIAKVAWISTMLPATLLAGTALLLMADSLARLAGPVPTLVERLGTVTMPIFLLHVIFVAGARILLTKLFGLSGIAILPLLVIVGIIGPVLAREAAKRLGLLRILALQ